MTHIDLNMEELENFEAPVEWRDVALVAAGVAGGIAIGIIIT